MTSRFLLTLFMTTKQLLKFQIIEESTETVEIIVANNLITGVFYILAVF